MEIGRSHPYAGCPLPPNGLRPDAVRSTPGKGSPDPEPPAEKVCHGELLERQPRSAAVDYAELLREARLRAARADGVGPAPQRASYAARALASYQDNGPGPAVELLPRVDAFV